MYSAIVTSSSCVSSFGVSPLLVSLRETSSSFSSVGHVKLERIGSFRLRGWHVARFYLLQDLKDCSDSGSLCMKSISPIRGERKFVSCFWSVFYCLRNMTLTTSAERPVSYLDGYCERHFLFCSSVQDLTCFLFPKFRISEQPLCCIKSGLDRRSINRTQ